jgi:DNA-binding NarL/FixJ family response regulator
MAFDPAPGEACRSFDLIVMGIDTQTLGQVATAILQVRACNHAPIVLLTEHEPLEWSLATLPAGADAVLSIHTPEEIILARCMALLRRWFSAL